MQEQAFYLTAADELMIHVYRWLPEESVGIKGVVQIAHGMAEEGARYKRLGEFLTERGYVVYCNDHRGHGKTAKEIDKLGYLADEKGFELLVDDMARLTDLIRSTYSTLPIFLFGHSMGSFATQRYMMLYGDKVDGIILSGTNGKQGPKLYGGLAIAKLLAKVQGKYKKSVFLDKVIFGGYNKQFGPNRTSADWLSRDEKEVDAYHDNPYCGTVFTTSFFGDFIETLLYIQKPKHIERVPKTLPVYIFAGDKDPVGSNGKGIVKLYHAYKAAGLTDVSYKLYKEGRHEMLNEINRDEVMTDILLWIEKHI